MCSEFETNQGSMRKKGARSRGGGRGAGAGICLDLSDSGAVFTFPHVLKEFSLP